MCESTFIADGGSVRRRLNMSGLCRGRPELRDPGCRGPRRNFTNGNNKTQKCQVWVVNYSKAFIHKLIWNQFKFESEYLLRLCHYTAHQPYNYESKCCYEETKIMITTAIVYTLWSSSLFRLSYSTISRYFFSNV